MKTTYSILLSIALLSGCASFNPKMGMSTDQFDSMCRKSFNGKSVIISAQGKYEIRQCQNKEGMTYVFENSRLISIERVAIEKASPETQSSNKTSNAAFVTAICSTLSKGKAAECAAGALNSDESDLARKLRQQDDETEALKRQQAIDRSTQRQKDGDRDYDKRREDLMNWKPGQKYTY